MRKTRVAAIAAGTVSILSLLACGSSRDGGPAESPSTDQCADPGRSYVSQDPQECRLLLFSCAEGTPFFDACGCGCMVERCGTDEAGNEVICGAGEFCCNESCGICAPLGGFCTQELCDRGHLAQAVGLP
jgi:hypothetical protein